MLSNKHCDDVSEIFLMHGVDARLFRNTTDGGGDESFGHRLSRGREHVVNAAGFHYFAGAYDRHTVGDLLHDVHLVGDEHDGDTHFLIDSSASRILGFVANALAMPTRCFWPPESCDGYLFA